VPFSFSLRRPVLTAQALTLGQTAEHSTVHDGHDGWHFHTVGPSAPGWTGRVPAGRPLGSGALWAERVGSEGRSRCHVFAWLALSQHSRPLGLTLRLLVLAVDYSASVRGA
jgi:hypothetical protein